jgi:S-adenosylmethionine/arginine decarboxylase-like enzyme
MVPHRFGGEIKKDEIDKNGTAYTILAKESHFKIHKFVV